MSINANIFPSSLALKVDNILAAADRIENENPRVAYLCRLHALQKVERLDPSSEGRGVPQFKTLLHRRVKREGARTITARVSDNDFDELRNFHVDYCSRIEEYWRNEVGDYHGLGLLYQTHCVLLEVSKALNQIQCSKHDCQILEILAEKPQFFVPYNILRLDPDSAIMCYPEMRAVLVAVLNTRALPWPTGYEKKPDEDILDWLQEIFGFQKDSVANQREHLIMLLFSVQTRQSPKPDQQSQLDIALAEVMKKQFQNYKKWCKYLGRTSSHVLPTIRQEVQQRKLLYMGLYLLIWGEAANLRFMPECLCYIYHHMAMELNAMLAGDVSAITGETLKPVYGGEEEAFLRKVVTPIYETITKEAQRSKRCEVKHSQWRNYDDLNEYFWSDGCFRLGWPMRADSDFFCEPSRQLEVDKNEEGKSAARDRWVGKFNFVESRSFWHIFRSFERMWMFLILCLQAMIIVGFYGSGRPSAIFETDVIKKVSSIFITAAILNLGGVVLDVCLSWEARWSMPFQVKLRYILKVLIAIIWVFVILVMYVNIWENPPGFALTIRKLFGNSSSSLRLYVLTIVIYTVPNMLTGLLDLFPYLRRYLEKSDSRIVMLMMWWSQLRLYVGRGMHVSLFSLFKYTMFWVLIIITKLAFSYYIEIKPLVDPTKAFVKAYTEKFRSVELYSANMISIWTSLILGVISIWATVILVYFMDILICYVTFLTLFGGIYGAFSHLGEIRTMDMLRSRFRTLCCAFNARLMPVEKTDTAKKICFNQIASSKEDETKFAQLWNSIISSFREEDLISDREMDLLLVPYWADCDLDLIQLPLFLLVSKIPTALDMAKDSDGKIRELVKRIGADSYMHCAVRECYASFRNIINFLVQGNRERAVIKFLFDDVANHIEAATLSQLKMIALPSLYEHFVRLINFLMNNKQEDRDQVVILFQDMLEVVTRDIMEDEESSILDSIHGGAYGSNEVMMSLDQQIQLFESPGAIKFPIEETEVWKEKIKRLFLMLTVKESAIDVPRNLEARRRILFFSNSLFMEMPAAPKVRNMLSFSVLTPYYAEDILFSMHELEMQNEDGVSILFYLQHIFPDEWTNFLERIGCSNEEELRRTDAVEEELRLWASYRGQTLSRTVRGMMYYRKALELQAFLDMANYQELMKGFKEAKLNTEEYSKDERSLWKQCQAVADMKFSYVVSCQQYGVHKRSGDARAHDILKLMSMYPSLRVAYIDEVDVTVKDKSNKSNQKIYYSTLVKAAPNPNNSLEYNPNEHLDQVIYRIKLPGPAILGEGKPENQNHAIIFTRGEGLQTIDMNQDNYMEEAFKMRNLLNEFLKKHDGVRYPSILGLREHIFTGSVSSLAWFMSNQETSFVTIVQRLLANPLKVRFHYGHPDVFDRLFHLTRGGISKASKTINLSEDIFVGFNSTLREGNVTHHEYMQVGKGRDLGLNQISMFEAKVANGNGEQTLSRDICRLGHRLDFFRMLSCYVSTVGFYFSNLVTVIAVYAFLYGRLCLTLFGLEENMSTEAAIQTGVVSQLILQIGHLMVLPMLMEIVLEKGFQAALSHFLWMQLLLAPVFFTFSLCTKAHYYGRTLLRGGAEYKATGRGFVVCHTKFSDNYRFYSRSHFVKAFEIAILLIVNKILHQTGKAALDKFFITISVWFMVGSWLFAPFLFNPSGFEWQKIVDDWTDWNKWISNQGGIGVPPEKSWRNWWDKEQDHLRHSGIGGIIAEIALALRFFIYQFTLASQLNVTKSTKSVLVVGYSCLLIAVILLLMKMVSVAKRKLSAKNQLMFRLIEGIIFCTVIGSLSTLVVRLHLGPQDIAVSVLSFVPTGWGLLLIAQACKPVVRGLGVWGQIRALARGYEAIMGLLVFMPVAFLAWFPFVSVFQTRILFNQAFSRGLQISHILGGQKKGWSARKTE